MDREGGPPIDLSQSTDDDRPSGPPAARRAGGGIEVIEIDDSSSEDGHGGPEPGVSRRGRTGGGAGGRDRGDSPSSVDSLENLSQFRRPGRRGGDARAPSSEAGTPPAAPSPGGASPRKRYDWIEAWMPTEGARKPDASDEGGGDELKMPERSATASGLYADATRPAVLAANPGSDGGEADRILAAMFDSLPADQKKMWHEMAR